jgi:uncharacterized protein YwlG (UPF0340 family)
VILAVIFVVLRVRGMALVFNGCVSLGRAKMLELLATCRRFFKVESVFEAVKVLGPYVSWL